MNGIGMSRRLFMRAMSLFSLGTLLGTRWAEAGEPATAASGTLLDALKARKSERAFDARPLPADVLAGLLWAAFGINRPDEGKRTAPSAMNWQEIDVYVLTAEGASVYDAKANALTPVAEGDLRAKAGGRGTMKDAPAHLVYVADRAKVGRGAGQSELFSACHCGFIGQNVYLFCAAEGLATCFHASVDKVAMKEALKLRDDQAVMFGQVVGYPVE